MVVRVVKWAVVVVLVLGISTSLAVVTKGAGPLETLGGKIVMGALVGVLTIGLMRLFGLGRWEKAKGDHA
ncbi:MAG: hypothetical protein VX874_06830 [Pseudomonadota bacterium]|nr:hypothetical protein [Pseudomonadota bacterium]